jgi:hypothetical protein
LIPFESASEIFFCTTNLIPFESASENLIPFGSAYHNWEKNMKKYEKILDKNFP